MMSKVLRTKSPLLGGKMNNYTAVWILQPDCRPRNQYVQGIAECFDHRSDADTRFDLWTYKWRTIVDPQFDTAQTNVHSNKIRDQ